MIEPYDKKKMGNRIRQLRLSKGLTQDEICDKTYFDPSTLSNYESGKNAPSPANLVKIINALDVEPNAVFDYSHFKNEKELEKEVISKFKNLPIEKKRYFYRLLNILEELC